MNKSVSLSMLAATFVLLFAGVVPASARNLMAVQPDGRIVLAGQGLPEGGALVRYLPDGQLDAGFGDGGIAIDRRLRGYLATSLQPDGRILTASQTYGRPEASVGRYLADGRPDPSFGERGLAVDPALAGNGGSPTTIVALPWGRVLVASNLPGGKYKVTTAAAITGLSPSGQYERNVLSLRGTSRIASDTIGDILPDSGIVVGSHPDSGEPEAERQTILRLQEGTPAGFDPAFGAGQGLSLGREGRAVAVAAEPAGGFAVVGVGAGGVGTVSRFDANGVLDPGFGAGGSADLTFPAVDGFSPTAVAVAPDGSVVVSGQGLTRGPNCYGCAAAVVTRLTPAGRLDPSFGAGGVSVLGDYPLATGPRPGFFGEDTSLLADGSILLAGTGSGGGHPFVLARLTPQGQLDPSFGNGGVVTTYTCKAAPHEAIQRGCFTRPRVSLRVANLRTAKPRLWLKVKPDPSWGQLESVRLVLPRALRLNARRIQRLGGLKARATARRPVPMLSDPRILDFEGLLPSQWLTLTLWKGAFRATKRLGAHQRLSFKVVVRFANEGNGPRVVVLHRRP